MENSDQLSIPEQRLQQGLATFTRAFRQLIARNGCSNDLLEKLAAWAAPDQASWLSGSQISMLRNGQFMRPGPKIFDQLGQLNLALAWYSGCDRGDAAAMRDRQLGKPPVKPWEPEDGPFWLAHPVTDCPLNAGDFLMVWLGRLQPAGLELQPTAEGAASLSRWLSRYCQQWCADRGKLLADGLPELLAAYPSKAPDRLSKLKLVVCGLDTYGVDDLATELVDLRAMAQTLDGGDGTEFPPLLAAATAE